IAIAEALLETRALVWFVTHFRELPRILAERAGVVNLHLAVDFDASSTLDRARMKMRYKIADGVEESHFHALVLARLVALPEGVLDVATHVSSFLNERNEAKRRNPHAIALARRRKLVLNLREQLLHARQSTMGVGELRDWLGRLQTEFVVRMRAIDADAE